MITLQDGFKKLVFGKRRKAYELIKIPAKAGLLAAYSVYSSVTPYKVIFYQQRRKIIEHRLIANEVSFTNFIPIRFYDPGKQLTIKIKPLEPTYTLDCRIEVLINDNN